MSSEMRSFMEAYSAVHSKEAKEDLYSKRDEISEMNLNQLTDGDLCEIVEEIVEELFSEGVSVSEVSSIFSSLLPESNNPGRQVKIDRLNESFKKVISSVNEKSVRTAVESYSTYRKNKRLQETWSNRFSHEVGNVRLHKSLVAEDREGVKSGLIKIIEAKKGDGNLANNYPPYDKVTRGDVIAGAKGEDQMGGKKKKKDIDEATAMAKRGYDEAPIRQKIAKSTGGGQAADRATKLADKSTFGDAKKAKQRQDLARKQRGDFRKTTSSSPGLHGYGHKSDDPKVKAKQAARGAQRGVLTPAEKKQLNREEFELWVDSLIEEGYDLSDYTWDDMYEFYLDEAEGSYGETPKAYSAASKTKMTAKRKPFLKAMQRRTNPANRTSAYSSPRKGMTSSDRERARAGSAHGMGTRDDHDYPSQGPGGVTKNPKKLRKQKAMGEFAKEDFDIFDVVLEFLQVEGYAETLEEAEWMMANLIDEEAVSIILESSCEDDEEDEKEMKKGKKSKKEEDDDEDELDEEYIDEAEGSYGQTPKARAAMGKLAIARRSKPASEYSQKGEKTKKVKSIEKHTQRIDNGPDAGNRGKKSTKPRYSFAKGRGKMDQERRDYARDSAVEYSAGGHKPGPGTVTKNPKKLRKQKAMGESVKQSFEAWLDEAITNYEKNRKGL